MFEILLQCTKNNELEGIIKIDIFSEIFKARSNFYKKNDYYNSWIKTIDKLFRENNSYFLTDVGDPKYSNWFNAWVIYKKNEVIYIQNKIFFTKEYDLYDVLNLKIKLDELSFESEFGDKISTWKTNVESLIYSYEKLTTLSN